MNLKLKKIIIISVINILGLKIVQKIDFHLDDVENLILLITPGKIFRLVTTYFNKILCLETEDASRVSLWRGSRAIFVNDQSFLVSELSPGYHKFKMANPCGMKTKATRVERDLEGSRGWVGNPSGVQRGDSKWGSKRWVESPKMADTINRV